MTLVPSRPIYSAWLHRWAVLTVCATVALLSLGTLVTTLHVGMTDPIWPTTPLYLFLIDWSEPSPGFLLEHSHRLAGYTVGLCAIGLAIGCWRAQPRRWVAWLGTAGLLAVIIQGLLGGFRVLLDQWLGQNLALIHGFFAQVVLSLLVSISVVTSRSWCNAHVHPENMPCCGIRRWTIALVTLVLAQLFFGGLVRHTFSPVGQRMHLMTAFAVVGTACWLVRLVYDRSRGDRPLVVAATLLVLLVCFQAALGVEVWMQRFLVASGSPIVQAFMRTLHFLIGGAILASAVATCLTAHRHSNSAAREAAPPIHELEGVA